MADLELILKSIKGYCSAGYQVGQKFTFKDPLIIPEGDIPLLPLRLVRDVSLFNRCLQANSAR